MSQHVKEHQIKKLQEEIKTFKDFIEARYVSRFVDERAMVSLFYYC